MNDSRETMVQTKIRDSVSPTILVSEVKKLEEKMDILEFFSKFHAYKGKRFFWKDPSGKNKFVGIGICERIECSSGESSYSYVEKKWKRILESAIVYNEFQHIGIGPVLLGGFSFDPQKEKTQTWNGFSEAHFYVPQFMLSEIDGSQFITTNILTQTDKKEYAKEELKKQSFAFHNGIEESTTYSFPAIEKVTEVDCKKWKETVDKVIRKLDGHLKKVVLARASKVDFTREIVTELVLKNLIQQQSNGYIFALEAHDKCFTGASPERLVKKEGDTVFSTCLAGSISRGNNKEEDNALAEELFSDSKNREEHNYVVKMIKNAMEKVCSTVEMPAAPQIMKMRDIQHLYTPVSGKVKETESLISLIQLLHPTPALGGYPRDEALEVIREVEGLDRGMYGAPIGWLDYKGNGEFAVSIRSGLLHGNVATIFAGCGIVADSDPELEYIETAIKFKPMLTALGGK
ncbi:isochorismate synthase [Niallia sp.]|uniref:isochorismate synthase n=1 Tax=Niallia sp. TaxID=2837523 RepID=UPI00289F2C60|nr:isochorismate synthase [Niallia sp.]